MISPVGRPSRPPYESAFAFDGKFYNVKKKLTLFKAFFETLA
jgi:hypothetical protein